METTMTHADGAAFGCSRAPHARTGPGRDEGPLPRGNGPSVETVRDVSR